MEKQNKRKTAKLNFAPLYTVPIFCMALLLSGCADEQSSTSAESSSVQASSSTLSSGAALYNDTEVYELTAGAKTLANHILLCMKTPEMGPKPDDSFLNPFVLVLAGYLENEGEVQNPEGEDYFHPYRTFATRDDTGLYVFPKGNMQQMIEELFGIAGWEPNFAGVAVEYNEEQGQYESGLEFGVVGMRPFYAEGMEANLRGDGSAVEVHFTLMAPDEEGESYENAGTYKMEFLILEGASGHFLRYNGIEKVG